MAYLVVKQSPPLKGTIKVSGAKNTVLPIMAASILTKGKTMLKGVPNLRDVQVMSDLLRYLGAKVEIENEVMIIDSTDVENIEAPYELVSKMRASFLVMGSLLGRFNEAKVSMPGGCAIGTRPIDLHLKGFEYLGCSREAESGYIYVKSKKLVGGKVYLDVPSVGATENIIMAATLAEGITVIENAAEEPEIVDLSNFLNKMGAKVRGAGTNTIRITGVKELKSCEHTIIPDRIEAGTYMIAAAMTKGDVVLENVICDHMKPLIAKLTEVGCDIEENENFIRVVGPDKLIPTNIKTMPHPGFPTDLQSPFMSLLCVANGRSNVTETVFENRFMNVYEMMRMGANIEINGKSASIVGVEKLRGAEVKATDLRAGAALVISGLVAEGETRVKDIYHIERGYMDIVGKLSSLGAKIYKVEE